MLKVSLCNTHCLLWNGTRLDRNGFVLTEVCTRGSGSKQVNSILYT